MGKITFDKKLSYKSLIGDQILIEQQEITKN